MVKSLYKNVTVMVSVVAAGDVHFLWTIGFLQGSNISPTLFIVFMHVVLRCDAEEMEGTKPDIPTKKEGVVIRGC